MQRLGLMMLLAATMCVAASAQETTGTITSVTDTNNVLTNFLPSRYNRANAPTCANPACTTILTGTGAPLNGIIVAGLGLEFYW